MIAPSLPADEHERLAELRALRLLDTPPEERFDRITRIASRVFTAPIAYIALVDADRQWFKSQCGLTSESTSRSVSFCGHTILSDEPLIIPDALDDERFHDNPMVVDDPRIRFYAGHPLKGPGGHNIGTLCIADSAPRPLQELSIETLGELARLAEHELGLLDLIATQRQLLETKSALLETREQLATELKHAAAYVESLLPKPLQLEGVRCEARFVPSADLGGDFVGFIPLSNGKVAAYLLDVTGHGVASSLMAVSINNAVRQHALSSSIAEQPAQMLGELNRAFQIGDHAGRFATMWYGVLDTRNRTLTYAGAGHHAALLVQADRADKLEQGDLPIGILPDTAYQNASIALPAAARVYVFSDGLFEQQTPAGEQYGLDALYDTIAKHNGRDAMDRVIADVLTACKTERFIDDVSMIELAIDR